MKGIKLSIYFFFVLCLSVGVDGQGISESDNYKYYTIVSNLDYSAPLKQRVQSAIEAYCHENGRAPETVSELLDFCFAAEYHPNDMVIDGFAIELLRIKEDYNGFYLVYFIGPDHLDDDCEIIMSQEEIDELDFENYMFFEGDIVLGGIENEVINLYKEKFLLKKGN